MVKYFLLVIAALAIIIFIWIELRGTKIQIPLTEEEGVELRGSYFYFPLQTTAIDFDYFSEKGSQPAGALAFSGFERPLFFLPLRDAGQFACVYDFDVGVRVIYFDARSSPATEPLSLELRAMVPKSMIYATAADHRLLQQVLADTRGMSNEKFRSLAVPTLRIAFIDLKPSRHNLIKRLEAEIARSTSPTYADGQNK